MKTLFIGGGPGGDTYFEKKWVETLGLSASEFLLWKQPEIAQAENAFHTYVESADRFLLDATQKHNGELGTLMVFSFGLQVLFHWIAEGYSLPFQKIKILGSNIYPLEAFESLAHRLKVTPAKLEALTVEGFWKMITAIASIPDWDKVYWKDFNSPGRMMYRQLQQEIPAMSMTTFQSVMTDWMQKEMFKRAPELAPLIKGRQPEVQIHLGNADPLNDPKKEGERYRLLFPDCTVHVHSSGHFVHYEKPEIWTS